MSELPTLNCGCGSYSRGVGHFVPCGSELFRTRVSVMGGLRQFQQTPTALVITDLLMPDMDGLEVTMALHRESPTAKIIVFTGGAGESGFLDVAKHLGAHRTMKQPITITELLQAVREELQDDSPQKECGPREDR